jgi:succinoglycan biosynthesis transport protein ExoP
MNSDNPGNSPVAGVSQATAATQFIAPKTDTTLSESLIILRNRRMAIITAMIVGILIGLYQSVTQPKVFEAFGRIQVRTGSSAEYKLSTTGALGDDPQRKMMTEVAILTSDTLLVTVARDMNLANNATFLGSREPVHGRLLEDPGVRQGVIKKFQKRTSSELGTAA